MTTEAFIVENVGNTCYIDSLLMALFYNQTLIDRLLVKDITETMGIYLQEYIKEKFVNLVRKKNSVIAEDINMIRTLCFQLGWRKDGNIDDEYINQQDVNEFYIFLMELFQNEQIETIRKTILEESSDTNVGEKERLPFIPLALPESQQSITVKQMLHNWIYDNVIDYKKEDNDNNHTIKGLNTHQIVNTPYLITLSVNRFNNFGIRIDTNVIIQKKIRVNDSDWTFHAAICHRGNSLKAGHYYAFLSMKDNVWFMFDDLEVPCLTDVKMDDVNTVMMLKKECVFLIYRLI
jgi:ubiquitin C-terminal hydrolase